MDINTIISKVLTGESNSEEMIEFVNWLKASEKNKTEFERIKSYWRASVRYEHRITAEESYSRLHERIQQWNERRKWKRRMVTLVSMAASVVLVFLAGYYVRISGPGEVTESFICLSDQARSTYYLSDSTKIVLNKHSKLVYDNGYGRRERRVKLTGEAYFEVKRNEAVPFIVEMNDASIRVLGTKFTVSTCSSDMDIETILIDGAIRFRSVEQDVLMKPNQKLVFNKRNRVLQLQEVNARQETAWVDGLMRFRSVPFDRLIEELAAGNGVHYVLVNQKLKDPELTFTGVFECDQSFESMLDVIGRTMQISWRKVDDTYYIK